MLFRSVVIDGRDYQLQLTPPRMSDVGGLFAAPEFRTTNARSLRSGELNQIAALDGQPIWCMLDKSQALDRAETLAPVWQARSELYAWLPEQGRIHACCPHCGDWRELDLLFYVLALRLPAWHFITTDGLLEAPALATPEPKVSVGLSGRAPQIRVEPRKMASRPSGMLRAGALRLELPSARAGLAERTDAAAAILGTVDAESELAAWWRYAPPEGERDDEHLWWRWDDAGFRAVLRIAVALRNLERGDATLFPSSPLAVERFFLADIHFVDIAYHATHELAVPADGGRAAITCRCGTIYLPVR